MPTDEPYTDPFWRALEDDRFLIHECTACGHAFFPPVPLCPNCHARDVEWVEADGRGDLYAFTRQHRTAAGFESPVILGTVELDEGPRILVRLDEAYDSLAIGDRVELQAIDYNGGAERGRLTDRPFFQASSV